MSAPMVVLTVGASLGVGAVAVPFVASLLSKPIAGEVVPTRITDLAGYLTLSSGKGLGFEGEDPNSQTSFGSPVGSSVPDVPGVSTPIVSIPPKASGPAPSVANNDKKRLLAVASFAAGAAIALSSFLLMRRAFR